LRLDGWALLAKSLRPPPDKYHGLEDVELRYRHRELDLMANPDTRELFENRAAVVKAVRGWLDEHGFLEVETPVLQPLYGGALARPPNRSSGRRGPSATASRSASRPHGAASRSETRSRSARGSTSRSDPVARSWRRRWARSPTPRRGGGSSSTECSRSWLSRS